MSVGLDLRATEEESDSVLARLGDTLGAEYTIERELAVGGMGRVFVAWQPTLGRRVAIKVIDAVHGVDAERFRQEILLSARLQHPHIVPVHSAGESGGIPFFVMPFVEGSSLRARIADGEVTVREALRILRDVAAALRHAHTRGIVHRDLKPENVLLTGGSAVVLDFGVAKAMVTGAARDGARDGAGDGARDGKRITNVGFTVGTPGYMAPEQVAGDPSLDARADVYAFGVVAFELCAGRAPFVGTSSEVLRQHLATPAPELRTMRPDVPRSLASLIAQCLAKDPAQRPASGDELLTHLEGVEESLSSATRGARTLGSIAATPMPAMTSFRWPSVAVTIPAAYIVIAGVILAVVLRMAEQQLLRDGVAAAAVMGILIGLPFALTAGVVLRLLGRERAA